MDAPPPRKPGIKLKIPAGNVPSSYNAYPGQPQDEDAGGWSLRPPPIPPRPGQNPSTSSLSTTDRSVAPSTPSASCSSSAYPAVMATPPPRRPILNANSSNASSTSVPKLSLVTSRSSPAPPLSLNTSSTSASTTASGSALRAEAGAGATATPGKKPGLSLSLSIPTPGSKPGSAGPSHPSPVYDEFGGVQTAYHGGLRTPTTTRARNGDGGYDTTATGQTTIGQRTGNESSYGYGYGEEDEGQKTIKGMTADLKNALSLMRITPTPTPGGSARGSLDGGDGTIDGGQEGYAGSEGGSSGVGTGPGLGRSTSRGSASAGNAGLVKAGRDAVEDELDPRNYETLMRLGEGAGGAVEKVKDKRTGKILAMKVITTSPNPAIHKQLLRELQFLNECQSPYVVEHYGSFLTSSDTCIGILMEFCEAGSLDTLVRKITRRGGRTSEKVLGKIAEAVLGGLDYLHERRIIHRDIKPSNILVTKAGQVKLCDFGVSGELVDSFAGTFTGTSFYMAPERIQGLSYSIKSDIWSLGLTLHEVAHNRFPFPPEGEPPLGGPIELLNFIVAQPVPRLIDSPEQKIVWTDGAQDFLAQCLIRSANERPYPRDLLKHPWILESSKRNVNLAKWVTAIHGW